LRFVRIPSDTLFTSHYKTDDIGLHAHSAPDINPLLICLLSTHEVQKINALWGGR